jgi:uncharacterized LabA/DUF88 family protein
MLSRSSPRSDSEQGNQRLALLIDADNAQASVIDGILSEVARFGEATVKRIYGDFTSPASASWKPVLRKHAINPVQQFAYTTGKNATDSRLIIDAMDLLYTGKLDAFCLVTSDSDFTGLAMRLREEGLTVYGFGEHKTPEAFRNACHRFIFTEVLRAARTGGSPKTVAPQLEANLPDALFREALEHTSDDDGWANLGAFGQYLLKLQPEFDARTYGFKKLSDLIKAQTKVFEVQERSQEGSAQRSIRVRAKTS